MQSKGICLVSIWPRGPQRPIVLVAAALCGSVVVTHHVLQVVCLQPRCANICFFLEAPELT